MDHLTFTIKRNGIMLLTDKESEFENENVLFDGNNNTILFKTQGDTIPLTELQARLIYILLTGVTNKREIIKMVWMDNHISISDNNYHQLIYQCRAIFQRHGIPSDVIKTIPRHGVKFNYSCLKKSTKIIAEDANKSERSIASTVLSEKKNNHHFKMYALLFALNAIIIFGLAI